MNHNVPKAFQWNKGNDADIFDILLAKPEESPFELVHACTNTINARYRLVCKRRDPNISFPLLSVEHVAKSIGNWSETTSHSLQALAITGIMTETVFRTLHKRPETDSYESSVVVPFPYKSPPPTLLTQKKFHIRGYISFNVDFPNLITRIKRNLIENGPMIGQIWYTPGNYRQVFRLPKKDEKLIGVMITGYRHVCGVLVWQYQNCEGAGWGNNGYGEITHDNLAEIFAPTVELDD